MIIGSSLASIPFLSSSDSTRLQMSSKQLSQTITHPNCERPYVISSDYFHLSNNCSLYRNTAEYDGEILYSNDEILVAMFNRGENDGFLQTFETPQYFPTTDGFCVSLRYKKDEGSFKKGEVLFEYDSFLNGVPSSGYRLNAAFMDFFGINFQDAIIITESAAKKMKSIKYEKQLIFVYSYSIFKHVYGDSKYGFIPEVGQYINGKTIYHSCEPKNHKSKSTKHYLQSLNLLDFSEVINDKLQFNTTQNYCKIGHAKISDIKLHTINKLGLIDKELQRRISLIDKDYRTKCSYIYKDLSEILGEDYSKQLMANHYLMVNYKTLNIKIDELAYIIELELVKESETHIGDKLANRYANKGVITKIIPDELAPVHEKTGQPIDIILGPLAIFNRMNLGQIIDATIAKAIQFCEKEILDNPENIPIILDKLIKISNCIGNYKYSQEIEDLKNRIINDHEIQTAFIISVEQGGLYFEAPGFCDFKYKELSDLIKQEFDIESVDSIRIKKETFNYIKEEIGIDILTPPEDIIFPKIFNGPSYTLKLKQLSDSKSTSRDLGDYSKSTKQPNKDRTGLGNSASRLGGMEFDGLLAHNVMTTIRELRTVKSDSHEMKSDLITQILQTGEYHLPESKTSGTTKKIIDSLIIFLNN